MPEYRLEIVNRSAGVARTAEMLAAQKVFALDIETAEWWNRQREQIALVQFAFRTGGEIKVVIVDPLAAGCGLEPLRAPLESADAIKVIHNAAFDAVKLYRQCRIETAPIFDTMLAARAAGEKKYSLQSQAAAHLNIRLNKSAQRDDWSRRPLDVRRLDYAARDAFATLLLYEHQKARKLTGKYLLKSAGREAQPGLPLAETAPPGERIKPAPDLAAPAPEMFPEERLGPPARALLGVISELSARYSPEQLSVSADAGRVGLAGWIIDGVLGREADIDEESAKLAISELCELGLVRLTEARRLEPTARGAEIWRRIK